jgi:hypothetical protein
MTGQKSGEDSKNKELNICQKRIQMSSPRTLFDSQGFERLMKFFRIKNLSQFMIIMGRRYLKMGYLLELAIQAMLLTEIDMVS